MSKYLSLYSAFFALGIAATAQPAAASYNIHYDGNFSELDTYASGAYAIVLFKGQTLQSQGCRFHVDMQATDGNLVLYGGSNNWVAYWNAGAQWRNATGASFQYDGNLVVYDPSGLPPGAIWNSHTNGSGATKMIMQNDGNLVIYTPSMVWKWKTNTAGRAPYTGPCPSVKSEATYIIRNGHSEGAIYNMIDNISAWDCANRCAQDRSNKCVAFGWDPRGSTPVCTLKRDDVLDTVYPGSGLLGGYIRGRRAQGQ